MIYTHGKVLFLKAGSFHVCIWIIGFGNFFLFQFEHIERWYGTEYSAYIARRYTFKKKLRKG